MLAIQLLLSSLHALVEVPKKSNILDYQAVGLSNPKIKIFFDRQHLRSKSIWFVVTHYTLHSYAPTQTHAAPYRFIHSSSLLLRSLQIFVTLQLEASSAIAKPNENALFQKLQMYASAD
jgi:hypothetical protein